MNQCTNCIRDRNMFISTVQFLVQTKHKIEVVCYHEPCIIKELFTINLI